MHKKQSASPPSPPPPSLPRLRRLYAPSPHETPKNINSPSTRAPWPSSWSDAQPPPPGAAAVEPSASSAPGLPAPSQREALAVLWSEGTTAVPWGRDGRDGGVSDGPAAAGRTGGGREAGSASADGRSAGAGVMAAGGLGLGLGGAGGKAQSAAGRRGGPQSRDPGVAVVVLRADGRVPPGHLAAVEADGRRRLLRDLVGLVPLRRAARVRLLSAAERAVTLPR